MKQLLRTIVIVCLSVSVFSFVLCGSILHETKVKQEERQEILDKHIKVDFDHYYQGYFYWGNHWQKELAQKIVDMDVMVNYDGIWCHHNTEQFIVLYDRLEVGEYCILDGDIYRVVNKTTGYADNGYHFEDGTDVPYGTNLYITTCQDCSGYAIYITELEELK